MGGGGCIGQFLVTSCSRAISCLLLGGNFVCCPPLPSKDTVEGTKTVCNPALLSKYVGWGQNLPGVTSYLHKMGRRGQKLSDVSSYFSIMYGGGGQKLPGVLSYFSIMYGGLKLSGVPHYHPITDVVGQTFACVPHYTATIQVV